MKLAFFNQENQFKKYLQDLKRISVMNYERNALIEKTSSIAISGVSNLNQLDLRFFFNYEIFPETILSGYPQWKEEQRNMQAGDTILQQVYLPPIPKFSQKVLFGVRIKEVIREENKCGFSYETLNGHVECGISYFLLEEVDGMILFKIQTFSKPGNFFIRLLGPVFAVPYQTYCTKKALQHVKKTIELNHSGQ